MKTTRAIKLAGVFFTLLVLLISLLGCAPASGTQSVADEFQVSFKLDSRLQGPTYGGERWVPPPYGPIAYSGTYTLEARTYYIDSNGREVEIDAEWIPADLRLVTVTPDKGTHVTITIHDVGETSLLVSTPQGKSKTLFVKAIVQNKNIQLVEISE